MKSFLENNITAIYGAHGRVWLKRLDQHVQAYCQDWHLENLIPVQNSKWNYVVHGIQHGQPICLKIGVDGGEITREYQALQAFENYGGARPIDHINNAILMERLVPGLPIS